LKTAPSFHFGRDNQPAQNAAPTGGGGGGRGRGRAKGKPNVQPKARDDGDFSRPSSRGSHLVFGVPSYPLGHSWLSNSAASGAAGRAEEEAAAEAQEEGRE
jgi:hypothetical protein